MAAMLHRIQRDRALYLVFAAASLVLATGCSDGTGQGPAAEAGTPDRGPTRDGTGDGAPVLDQSLNDLAGSPDRAQSFDQGQGPDQGKQSDGPWTRPSADLPPPVPDILPPPADLPPAAKDLPPAAKDLPPAAKDLPPLPLDQGFFPVDDQSPPQLDLPPPPKDLGPPSKDLGPSPKDLGPPPKDLGPPPKDLGPPPADLIAPPKDLPPPPGDGAGPKDFLVLLDQSGTDGGSGGCMSACGCPQGWDCLLGVCAKMSQAKYCCSKPGCPVGAPCVNANGTAGYCPTGGTGCKTHCDCPQKQMCAVGKCIVSPVPIYCCAKPGCPTGQPCFKKNGSITFCP